MRARISRTSSRFPASARAFDRCAQHDCADDDRRGPGNDPRARAVERSALELDQTRARNRYALVQCLIRAAARKPRRRRNFDDQRVGTRRHHRAGEQPRVRASEQWLDVLRRARRDSHSDAFTGLEPRRFHWRVRIAPGRHEKEGEEPAHAAIVRPE